MSELRADSRPKNSTAFWRVYMLSWAVLAGGALTYLIVPTVSPDSLNTSLAKAPETNPEPNRADHDRQQLSAQVRSLNETVASLRTDLARLKQTAGDRNEAPKNAVPERSAATQPGPTVQQEVSNISTSALPKPEVKMPAPLTEAAAKPAPTGAGPVTIVNAAPSTVTTTPSATQSPITTNTTAAVPATTTPAAETQPSRRRNLATTLLRPGSVPPLPPYNFQRTASVANPFSNNPASKVAGGISQTARDTVSKPVSVVKTAVATAPRTSAFGAPVVKPRQPSGSAALSLSTAQSVTGLRASWLLLTTRHPNIFVGYQPRYIADQANGNYRLLAGPIANHSDADRICTELRAQNVSCGVTAYVGSAL